MADVNGIREAVVPAGGFGTRLRPVIRDVPKALAPVAGRPFLHWLLEDLARQGVARVLLAEGHMGDVLHRAVGARHAGMEMLYAREDAPLAERSRFGSLLAEGNRVLGFSEKGQAGAGVINGCVYLARRDLPARRPMPVAFSLEDAVLAAPGTLDLRAHGPYAAFLDIGTPEDHAAAQTLIPGWAAAA